MASTPMNAVRHKPGTTLSVTLHVSHPPSSPSVKPDMAQVQARFSVGWLALGAWVGNGWEATWVRGEAIWVGSVGEVSECGGLAREWVKVNCGEVGGDWRAQTE